ncbi:MAG: flagellar hook-length control protein FliK [Treponema sp.]|nr:flagellar hook-length control protein FliK [Treponema sp.]
MQSATAIIESEVQLQAYRYAQNPVKQLPTSGNNGISFLDQLKKELNKEEFIPSKDISAQKVENLSDNQKTKLTQITDAEKQTKDIPDDKDISQCVTVESDAEAVTSETTAYQVEVSDESLVAKNKIASDTDTDAALKLVQKNKTEAQNKKFTDIQENDTVETLLPDMELVAQNVVVPEQNQMQPADFEKSDGSAAIKVEVQTEKGTLLLNTESKVDESILDDITPQTALLANRAQEQSSSLDSSADKRQSADSKQKDVRVVVKNTKNKDTTFTVTDLRSEEQKTQPEVVKHAAKSDFVTSITKNSDTEIQMTLNLSKEVQQNITASNDQSASATGSTYQSMLSNQLQNNAMDIVKAGSIVLRDNNIGNINLILHPESLGNVKINLQLTDKVIAGHITVASKEAFAAFQENIGSLKEAFTQNGFENASFDLSWSGQQNNMGFAGREDQNTREFLMQRQSHDMYGDYAIADTVSDTPATGYDSGYAIDVSV